MGRNVLGTLLLGLSAASVCAADTPGESFQDCPDCPEMVAVPAGEYFMGATDRELEIADLPPYFDGREKPRHRVRIERPFAVARYELSIAQYRRFVEASGYEPAPGCWAYTGAEFIFDEDRSWDNSKLQQAEDHPVTCIAWVDAIAYADWLSEQTGEHYRLLSEAEWEYVARSGRDTVRWFGDDADDICSYVNLGDITTRERYRWHEQTMKYEPLDDWINEPCRDGWASTAPVSFGPPNPFGVHNMHGNVQELVLDCWHPNYASGPATQAPRVTSGDCAYRMMRGQGWSAIAASTRAAFRARMLATDRRFYLGIRLARELKD